MLQAAFTLAFFVFLRCREFTQLTRSNEENLLQSTHIAFEQDGQSFSLRLRGSKTDPFRHGIHIRVFKSGGRVCPVHNMQGHLKIRRELGLDTQYPPLFLEASGRALSRT